MRRFGRLSNTDTFDLKGSLYLIGIVCKSACGSDSDEMLFILTIL